MLGTILLVIVILMLVGAIPTWPHSREWGYYPSGGLGLVLNSLSHPADTRPYLRCSRRAI